jgi:LysM repeat protein
MTFAQWLRFRGVCGHQHVPENDHRDPGAIDINKLMRFAAVEVAKAKGTTPPAPARSTARTVVVRAGQTLAGIAAAAGITLAALLAVNPNIHDPNRVVPGQVVTVPPSPSPSWTFPIHPTPKPTATPKPAPRPAPKPAPRARATVQLGSTGPLVRIVQRAVHVKADGDFGPKTRAAVKAFQKRHKLTPDGVVGAKTWAVIGA